MQVIWLAISIIILLGLGMSGATVSAEMNDAYPPANCHRIIAMTSNCPGSLHVPEGAAATSTAALSEKSTCSIRIMPLGDSNTKGGIGSSSESGYRRGLWLALDGAGYDVDFVGRLQSGLTDEFDRDHEGHDGQSAAWMSSGPVMNNILTANPPDIILLHIGTNDISAGWTAESTAEAIEGILDKIDGFEGSNDRQIMVFLAQIINRKGSAAQIEETSLLNELISELAAMRIASADQLILVDMEHALTYPDDLHDGVHPNDDGYDKMSAVWLDALETYLPQFCALPTTRHQYISFVTKGIQ